MYVHEAVDDVPEILAATGEMLPRFGEAHLTPAAFVADETQRKWCYCLRRKAEELKGAVS